MNVATSEEPIQEGAGSRSIVALHATAWRLVQELNAQIELMDNTGLAIETFRRATIAPVLRVLACSRLLKQTRLRPRMPD
jgi:hypothetical protein